MNSVLTSTFYGRLKQLLCSSDNTINLFANGSENSAERRQLTWELFTVILCGDIKPRV